MQQLQKFEEKVDLQLLNQLKSDYEKLVVTRTNLKEVDEARKKLKRIRLDIQAVTKANKATLKEMLDKNQKKEDEYLSLIEPIENRLNSEQKAIEAEIEREKQEAEARRQRIENEFNLLREKMIYAPTMVYVNVLKGYMELGLPKILEGTGREEEWYEEYNKLKRICEERIEYLNFKEAERIKEPEQKAKLEVQVKEHEEVKNSISPAAKLETENKVVDIQKEEIPVSREIPQEKLETPIATRPAFGRLEPQNHRMEYMGYVILFDIKMSEELFNQCADSIRMVLDANAPEIEF